jgi:hypothetical protein
MEENVQNANPTVLNASDLPSRRRESTIKHRKDGGSGLFDSLQPNLIYLYNAFNPPLPASDSEEDDDDSVEDIDEQEIYGIAICPFLH